MPEYDDEKKRLIIKVVYYGPALSGKTTNITRLHDLLDPELKGEMMILETKDDRTLFFDMLPLGVKTKTGMLIKLKLFTVPGQVAHDSTRKAVLSRADGVVFVADSQLNQKVNNANSFENLADNANKVGLDFENMAIVIQYNKRDLPEIESEDIVLKRWSKMPWPVVFASALPGDGVLETFKTLLGQIYTRVDDEFNLCNEHSLTENDFISGVMGGQ